MPASIFTLRLILNNLYRTTLDCDGQTRIIHFVLSDLDIPHTMWIGEVEEIGGNNGFAPHYWITLQVAEGAAVIDYKAQKWLGDDEHIPFGVFLERDYPNVQYEGQKMIEKPLFPGVISLLLTED